MDPTVFILDGYNNMKLILSSSSKDSTMTLTCMVNQNAELPRLQGLVQRSLCDLDGPTHAFSGTSVRNTRKRDIAFCWDDDFNSHMHSSLLLPSDRRGLSPEWRGLEKKLREAEGPKSSDCIASASQSCLDSTTAIENKRVFFFSLFCSFIHFSFLKIGSHVTRAGLQLSM